MFEAGHLSGGAGMYLRYPVLASMTVPGIVACLPTAVGITVPTTTSFVDAVGLALDTATYSTSQADLDDGEAGGTGFRSYGGLDMGRMVTVSVRPDLLIRSRVSGSATQGVVLTTLVNTSASAGGTTISDTDVGSADMTSGVVWCTKGNNLGYARHIVTHNSAVSFVVTVPFPRAIAVNDEFLWMPFSGFGTFASGVDGFGAATLTTLLQEVRGDTASGSGGEIMVVKLELESSSNSNILFMLRDHQWNRHTVPS